MRFKLKEGTQRASLRVILSLNLIVPVDEMGAVEPVGRLTFEINDDEVCVKNCELDAMWWVAPLSKIHGFVKAELEGVMGKQTCRANKRVTFTVIVERVNSLCQLLNLLGTEALYGLVTDAFFARHDFLFRG